MNKRGFEILLSGVLLLSVNVGFGKDVKFGIPKELQYSDLLSREELHERVDEYCDQLEKREERKKSLNENLRDLEKRAEELEGFPIISQKKYEIERDKSKSNLKANKESYLERKIILLEEIEEKERELLELKDTFSKEEKSFDPKREEKEGKKKSCEEKKKLSALRKCIDMVHGGSCSDECKKIFVKYNMLDDITKFISDKEDAQNNSDEIRKSVSVSFNKIFSQK